MENLVQFETLSLDLDGAQVVSRKIVIDELQAHGIRLSQKRTHPAQLPEAAEPAQGTQQAGATSQNALPGLGGLSIKSPEEILKSEKLETLEAGNRIKKNHRGFKSQMEK